jgi:hypothetical protein
MADGDGGSGGVAVDPARSALQTSIGNRNVTVTPEDVAAAQKLYAELPAAERTPAALRALERDVAQNKYDAAIDSAVADTRLRAPDAAIDPLIVKSLLYQESNMQANPNAHGAYRGIAQIGKGEARASGLTVDGTTDDRLDPVKAISAVPKILERYDYALPYSKYVKEGLGTMPQGDDRARFYLAAYNGGPGTISEAMKLAAADGKNPLDFQNLLAQPGQPIEASPLYRAIDDVLRKDAPSIDPHEKYTEISSYANDIVARAEAMHASVAPQTPGHARTPVAPPPAAQTPAPHAPAPHAPAPHAGPTHAPQPNDTGAYDRNVVRSEVGAVPLGTSRDLTDTHLTQRSLVDALGNLEAHAGVPITVSVINTGHSSSVVDNVNTHGHKAGYAADLYVDRNHDTPAAREKLIEAIGKDPYVTKVGLGGDYDTAANREALRAAGKIVFEDNDQSNIHVQSEIDPKKLAREEAQDTTSRSERFTPKTARPGKAGHGASVPHEHVQTDYTAPKIDRILGETRDGKLVETKAELEAKNALLAKAESDARRGIIDNVRFVGNGRESAREVARQNEKLWRGIENNLPADGSPPLPPARANGYTQSGKIVSVENGIVTQDIGRGRTAEYAASDFRTPPVPGSSVTVQYQDGTATALAAREPQAQQLHR